MSNDVNQSIVSKMLTTANRESGTVNEEIFKGVAASIHFGGFQFGI